MSKKAKQIVVGVLVIIIALAIAFPFLYNGNAKADTTVMIATIKKSSELTTAKISFTGMTEYKDEGIKVLNSSDFIMVYKATARIGIDVEKVEVESNNIKKIVYVEIPQAEVLDVKVDGKTIKYFDEKFALFNVDEREDAAEALALAEKGAKKEIEKMGTLEMADNQFEALIKGILANAIPKGYTIEVKIKD